jgi:AcrR family transcriptional regulator
LPSEDLSGAQRARRGRLIAATVALMVEHDYDAIQMKDVTASANVALGTTYRYFSSKDHLFAEALCSWCVEFGLDEEKIPAGTSSVRLKAGYRAVAQAFARHPPIFRHILALQATNDPIAAEVFNQLATNTIENFLRLIPRVPSPRRERIIKVMNAVLDARLRDWALGRQSIEDVDAAVDDAVDLLLD